MSKRIGLGIGLLAAGLTMGSSANADTVGLWLFDTFEDVTPPAGDPPVDPAGGETFPDSSVNGFDFLATTNFGTYALETDRPAVMPSGTFALDSHFGGAGGPKTPNTTLLGRGATGEMTVEFWYKPTLAPSFIGYLFDYANTGSEAGRWGIYLNSDGSLRYFDTYNGFIEVNLGTGVQNGNWNHVAFTVDAAGVITGYLNGSQIAQSAATGAAGAAFSASLKFGGNYNFEWGDHRFLIDELRISDVALLPGNGTGVDELAWNASLVPEPASVALMGLGALALVRRRR